MKYYGIQNEVKAYLNRLQSEQGISASPSVIKTLNDRVEALKKSGVWSQFSLGFNDVDGDAYLSRAGVTDILGRAEVLWFTRGMKALDLWSSMVSWPMRSYQNKGTASTVYSLGGLGVYNADLINGATWGSTGITSLLASAQGVTINIGNTPLTEQTLFGVGSSLVSNQVVLIARNNTGGNQNGMNLRSQESSNTVASIQQSGGSTTLSIAEANTNTFKGYAVASNTSTAKLKRFPSTSTVDTALSFTGNLTNGNPLWIGRRASSAGTNDNVMAFASVLIKDIRSNWDYLYLLYSSTLGNGLGLP